jgi:tryptophan 2,3-dioxygenase
MIHEERRKKRPVLDDLMAAARKRAQEKKDSQATGKKDLGRTTQIEEVRKDRLRVAFELTADAEQDAKKTDSSAALQELVEIYTSIEKNNRRMRFAAVQCVKRAAQEKPAAGGF